MKKTHALILTLSLTAMVFAAGFSFGLGNNGKTLIKVGESTVTLGEFNEKIDKLPEQVKTKYDTPEGRQQLLESMKRELVLFELAKQKGYAENKEVKEMIKNAQRQIMMEIMLRDMFKNDIKVSNKDVKKYYDENIERFEARKELKASHILVKTEAEAKAIVKALNGGKDFATLAKEKSTGPSGRNGGDIGFFGKGQMVKPFENAAFNLKVGEVSKPVQTQFGWHVIKITDTKEAPEKKLKEVEDVIKRMLEQQKQKELFEEIVTDAETKIEVEVNTELILKK